MGTVDGETFFAQLREWDDANFVMGASCNGGCEDALDNGLVTGHAYSLIHVKEVEADGAVHRMICLRNPWGNDHEWNGQFSDNCPAGPSTRSSKAPSASPRARATARSGCA